MRGFLVFGIGIGLTVAAQASDLALQPPLQPDLRPVSRDYWTVTVGVDGRYQPRYPGADSFQFVPYPLFNVRRAGAPEPLLAYRDGLDYAIVDTGAFRLGPVGQVRLARKVSNDFAVLHGLGDVDAAVEIGAFAEYWVAPWLRTRLELRHGFSGHDGMVADASADAVWQLTPQLQFFAGPRVTFASSDANDPYFSVTPAQSLASGLPVYAVGGGLRAVGAGAQLRYKWNPAWGTHVFVEYDRLQGSVADAPLVRLRGSADQLVLGVGTTYAFDMKAWW